MAKNKSMGTLIMILTTCALILTGCTQSTYVETNPNPSVYVNNTTVIQNNIDYNDNNYVTNPPAQNNYEDNTYVTNVYVNNSNSS